MSALPGQPEHFPPPGYLLGALIEDEVPVELARRIAEGYAGARHTLGHDQTHQWLTAMLAQLGDRHGRASSTALSVYSYPSEHVARHYDDLVASSGWKD